MSQFAQEYGRRRLAFTVKIAWIALCLISMAGWMIAIAWGALRLAQWLVA
jgi:type III secretory pathway component EscS